MTDRVLVDSCIFMDVSLPFRAEHSNATLLFRDLHAHGAIVHIPSHAYFEMVTALVVHYKREPDIFRNAPFVDPRSVPPYHTEVVPLDLGYVMHLMAMLQNSPIPDLKSQDMIYFCIAKDKHLTLLTEDRKLRNLCRRADSR